jgi:hypothetical protein
VVRGAALSISRGDQKLATREFENMEQARFLLVGLALQLARTMYQFRFTGLAEVAWIA